MSSIFANKLQSWDCAVLLRVTLLRQGRYICYTQQFIYSERCDIPASGALQMTGLRWMLPAPCNKRAGDSARIGSRWVPVGEMYEQKSTCGFPSIRQKCLRLRHRRRRRRRRCHLVNGNWRWRRDRLRGDKRMLRIVRCDGVGDLSAYF